LQDGSGTTREDLLLQGLQDGAGTTDLLVQGLQDGSGTADEDGVLHGVQAGVLPEDDPMLEVRAEVRPIHRDAVCAEVRVQASSG